ncbi:MAG: hypothetical protein ABF868_02105 [Sporolactobacillus sp.]
MNLDEFQGNVAHASFTLGKIMAAIGQTPIEGLDQDVQNDLVFYASLIQVAAGVMLIDFFTDNPTAQLGINLTVIGYGSFVLQFIRDVDDPVILTVRARSANLKEVLGNFVIVSDPDIRERFYWTIGAIIVALGNLLEALGRTEILRKADDAAFFNRKVTQGSWMEAVGSAIITLGYLYETTIGFPKRRSGQTFQNDHLPAESLFTDWRTQSPNESRFQSSSRHAPCCLYAL